MNLRDVLITTNTALRLRVLPGGIIQREVYDSVTETWSADPGPYRSTPDALELAERAQAVMDDEGG